MSAAAAKKIPHPILQDPRYCLTQPFLFMLILLSGCETLVLPDKVFSPKEYQYPPIQFHYEGAPSSVKADLVLALLAPTYALADKGADSLSPIANDRVMKGEAFINSRQYTRHLLAEFFSSMELDCERTLIVEGFRTLGPFADKADMTYPQREQSDFVFHPKITIDIYDDVIETVAPERQQKIFRGGDHQEGQSDITIYDTLQTQVLPGTVVGRLSANARIEFHLYEPLSWEKMWIKTVRTTAPVAGSYSYEFNFVNGQLVIGEDSRPQVLGEILTRLYSQVLTLFQAHLDTRELQALATKAKEIRERKRF